MSDRAFFFKEGVRLLNIDNAQAIACFERAEQLGCGLSALNLGVLHREADDLDKAEFWLRRALTKEHRQTIKTKRILCSVLREKDTPETNREAELLLRELADAGDAPSLFLVYRDYLYATPPNKELARVFCVKAADAGSVEAQHDLAEFYFKEGRPAEAAEYFQKSADGGFTAAEFNVGTDALRARDFEKARKYLTLAADKGMDDAEHNLGTMLLCEQIDKVTGALYLARAAKKGKADSLKTLQSCAFDKAVVGTCCIACGETERKKLFRCKGCRVASFCNAECANKTWKVHKRDCKLWAKDK